MAGQMSSLAQLRKHYVTRRSSSLPGCLLVPGGQGPSHDLQSSDLLMTPDHVFSYGCRERHLTYP